MSLQAKEYFEKAADDEEPGEEASGHYNLGVMYLKGIGVKRDVKLARNNFIKVANAGHPKAFYQVAKMFHTGIGLKKNLPMVNLRHFCSSALFLSLIVSVQLVFLLTNIPSSNSSYLVVVFVSV